MNDTDDTEVLLDRVQHRDEEAERLLFDEYFHRLMALARKRLPRRYAKARDESDLAQSTIKSVFRRCALGAFPDLRNRESLWAVMATILMRKLVNTIEFERAARRDQDRTVSAVGNSGSDGGGCGLPSVNQLDRDRRVQKLSQNADVLIEYVERGLALLTARQRQIATLILEGMNPSEVARVVEVVPSTVYRTLDRIASIWKEQLGE